MTEKKPNFLARFMKSASNIEHNELRSVMLSFLFVFCLMFAWYLLRPVRDAMASEWSDAEVSFLWNINFFISAAVVALYGIAVSRIAFSKLVPGVYAFFGLSFVVFYFASGSVTDTVLLDKIFYVWVCFMCLFSGVSCRTCSLKTSPTVCSHSSRQVPVLVRLPAHGLFPSLARVWVPTS